MKNLKDRANKLITVFAVFALALCAAGCNNILQPKAVSPGADSGKGLVQIHIGTVAGRTLLPAQTDLHINQWVITFTAAGSNQRPSQTFTGADLSQPMQVEEGEWALSLEAKKDGTVIAGGTASSNITVITGQQVSATVTLVFTAPGGGAGSLEYTITNNSGITPYSDGIKIELTPLSGGGTPETIGSTLTGTKSNINAGYYLVSATLSGDGKKALKSDVAHIYKGQTTKLNWTFLAADFHMAIENVWLVGAMNTPEAWKLPGTPMTAQADGAFAWAGHVAGDHRFRFSLLDTTGWSDTDSGHNGDNKWWGHWFAPENDNTSGAGSSIPVNYYHYTKKETAWQLPSDGWYTIVLDPFAKTMTAERPVIVESVTVGGDGVIAKGVSKTYTAAVAGKNLTGAEKGVTWSITSSGHHAGTTIGASTGLLTINQAESQTSVTIKATSTHTGTVHGEKTIVISSVPQAGQASVLDLSNMGLATWKGAASETGVTGYTVTLYKTGTPNTLIDTQSVIKGAAYSVDFLAAMRTAGAGDYGFTITTVGDGTTLLDSNETALSNTQTVSQLGSHLPQWLWWDGVNAKWKDVNTDLSNISKYSVQLYKDGTAVGNAVEVEMSTGIIDTDGGNNGKAFANNFASSMITAGSYTFKVKAIGIGLHLDSAEKPSSSVTVAHRPKVAYAWWLNADTARWVNPDGNGNYTVQLYKNGVAVGSPVSVTRQSTTNPSNAAETVTDHNFSAAKLGVGDIGWYTFTVTAKGDGALKLDATETSDMSGKTGFSPFGTSRPWAIVEGGGKIVAGADGGKIAYSTNGTHWVLSMQTVFGVNEAVRGIAYSSALGSGNGRFVAVGYNGKAAYSDDGGVTWTAATTGLSSSLLTVAYGNNKFIAGGDGGEVRASVDGMNWTGITGWDVSSILDHETVMTLVYANGNFVAAGNKGKVAYSADGSKNWNWSQDVAGTTDPNRKGMLSIAYNSSGVFVAAMKTNTHLVYSKNPCVSGAAWSWVEHHVGADIEAAAFGNGKFIVVGAGGKASTSSDGATWGAMTVGDDATDKTQFNTGEAIRTVGFTGSQFILAGEGKFAAITP